MSERDVITKIVITLLDASFFFSIISHSGNLLEHCLEFLECNSHKIFLFFMVFGLSVPYI